MFFIATYARWTGVKGLFVYCFLNPSIRMKCPFCSHSETQVVETRISEDGDFIRRRRQCGSCEKRFTTYERPDVNYPSIVK